MEKVLVKYSDFINNDGGFDKIRADFKSLGDDLIKDAKAYKAEIQKAFNLNDLEGVAAVEAKTEGLVKAMKKYGEARENVDKIEKEYQKQVKKTNQTTDDQIDTLVKLDNELQTHRSKIKEINVLSKLNTKTDRDWNKERVEAELQIKKVSKEIRDQQKEILKGNELSRKEQKLLKAKITLQKEEINTLDDVRERMAALRVVVQSLDLKTQADQIKSFNDEIDELTQVLAENSDKFIQNKINIGNYEESIVNALKKTGLFTTGISGLDSVLEGVLGLFTKSADEIAEMEDALDQNSGALKRFTVSFGKLNTAMKASVIGIIVVAIAALASAFGNTRAGSIRLEKTMATLSSTLTSIGQVARATVTAVVQAFEILSNPLNWANPVMMAKVKQGFTDIKNTFTSGTEAVVKGLENIDNAYKLEDKIARTTQEVARLNNELQILNSIADDSTKSLTTNLKANERALQLQDQIAKKKKEIAADELEAINEKVKQNILANGIEVGNLNLSAKGEAFAKSVLDLAERRGSALEISNDLIGEQQAAVANLITVEGELALTTEENGRKRREIQRDIFEQNLDLLIDLIDTEKNISEQYVNDVTKSFQNRLNEFNRFLVVFRQNSQRELDEFTKEAANLGLDIPFSIAYDENGDFKVFAGDLELATDNVVQLNQQLQGLGINEIDINRFREFMVEARNGVRDFRTLNKELQLVGINVKEMRENLSVSQDELTAMDSLQEKIGQLNSKITDKVPKKERDLLIKQVEELEKQKTDIKEFAEFQRIENRKQAIDAELLLVEKESSRYYELLQERLDLEKELREKSIDQGLEKSKDANKKAAEDFKKYGDEVKQIIDAIADKAVEAAAKRVDAAEKQVERQNELVALQSERAQTGLANTLAFEQRELGKREADRIKAEKKKERLEKIRALYSSYSNYSSQGDKNPIVKALRDFAILEAITASFGDGGAADDVIKDKIPHNGKGITRGRSHRGRNGGIAVRIEGKEGFFSGREMGNLGKDNFYKMKDLASMGKVDSNFFSQQRESFVKLVPSANNNDKLVHEFRQVKAAIENKPVASYDFKNLADGTIEILETLQSKNSTKKNSYITKKPRI